LHTPCGREKTSRPLLPVHNEKGKHGQTTTLSHIPQELPAKRIYTIIQLENKIVIRYQLISFPHHTCAPHKLSSGLRLRLCIGSNSKSYLLLRNIEDSVVALKKWQAKNDQVIRLLCRWQKHHFRLASATCIILGSQREGSAIVQIKINVWADASIVA